MKEERENHAESPCLNSTPGNSTLVKTIGSESSAKVRKSGELEKDESIELNPEKKSNKKMINLNYN